MLQEFWKYGCDLSDSSTDKTDADDDEIEDYPEEVWSIP
jgi:hypothetical protein